MAVKQAPTVTTPPLICLSSDTKPAQQAGHLAYETDTGAWYIYNGSAWVTYQSPPEGGASQQRSQFIAHALNILGDAAMLWLPQSTDTTSSTDVTRNQRTITHNATVTGRLGALGLGYYVSFDGSTNYSYLADADAFSVGDGSLDGTMSMGALARVTNTANNRTAIGKFTTGQREYRLYWTSADLLVAELYDQSASATEQIRTDAASGQGAWALSGVSYDGSEDADGMSLYVNGAVVSAVTRTSDVGGTYVAMENGTSVLAIGSGTSAASFPFQGDMALVFFTTKNLSAADWWNLRELCNGYFGFLG